MSVVRNFYLIVATNNVLNVVSDFIVIAVSLDNIVNVPKGFIFIALNIKNLVRHFILITVK